MRTNMIGKKIVKYKCMSEHVRYLHKASVIVFNIPDESTCTTFSRVGLFAIAHFPADTYGACSARQQENK